MDSIDLLKELIKIDSSTIDKANEAIDYVVDYFNSNGINGRIIENNGYKSFVCQIGSGDKILVLNGHLDVVSGNGEQFEPFEKDGRLYGRGSADMKGGCVAMIQTIINLKDKELPCKVMLQLVTDEEIGGFNCSRHLVEKGYTGDIVICTEPTNLGISIQCKGFMRLLIEFKGISAHGSRPWEGENAILKAVKNYEKIANLPIMKIGSEFYDSSTSNLAIIEGGDIYNRVPDKSKIGIDIRYVPHLNPAEILQEIQTVVDGNVELVFVGPGVNVLSDNSYVVRLKQTIKNVLEQNNPRLFGQHGSADTRFFSDKGATAVEFGPVGANWHGEAEYVEIQSIYDLEKILKQFILGF